ncbi:hypothetical protein PWT90_05633 [Aphanocladium album]|nr:hypothetical protein PWT90_05633 [Aphanocladium album]
MSLRLLSLSTEMLTLIVAASADAAAADARELYPDEDAEGATFLGVLGNLRLTCARLSAAASPLMFRSITLHPDSASIARWNALLDHDDGGGGGGGGPRAFVRRVVFDSGWRSRDGPSRDDDEDGDDDDDDDGDDEPFAPSDAWRAAVARLGEFVGVDEVGFCFSRACAVDDEEHEDYNENEWFNDTAEGDGMALRRTILTAVFEAMAGLGQGRRIRSLTIENLQNAVDRKFTDEACFGTVINGLEELHVDVVSESDHAAPEYTLALPAVVKFWPAFTDTWLRPAAPTLTALTLYSDNYFGALPYWLGTGAGGGSGGGSSSSSSSSSGKPDEAPPVEFPKLQRLALGNYAIAYESQLDGWLASAAVFPRLERLTLDDCPVLSHLLVYTNLPKHLPPVDRSRLDVFKPAAAAVGPPDGAQEGSVMLTSRLRWDAVFDRLREGLPTLKQFFFISGPWRDGNAFAERDTNVSVFVARRYLGWHEGIGPSQFTEPDRDYNASGMPKFYWDSYDREDYYASGMSKLYWDSYGREDYRMANEDGEYGDDENDKGLAVPSNDPEVWKADREAFDRLNETWAQRAADVS